MKRISEDLDEDGEEEDTREEKMGRRRRGWCSLE